MINKSYIHFKSRTISSVGLQKRSQPNSLSLRTRREPEAGDMTGPKSHRQLVPCRAGGDSQITVPSLSHRHLQFSQDHGLDRFPGDDLF